MDELLIGNFFDTNLYVQYKPECVGYEIMIVNPETGDLWLDDPITREEFVKWVTGVKPLPLRFQLEMGNQLENIWIYQFTVGTSLNDLYAYIEYNDQIVLLNYPQTILTAIKLNGVIVITRSLRTDKDAYPVTAFASTDDFRSFYQGEITVEDQFAWKGDLEAHIEINMNDYPELAKATPEHIENFLNH